MKGINRPRRILLSPVMKDEQGMVSRYFYDRWQGFGTVTQARHNINGFVALVTLEDQGFKRPKRAAFEGRTELMGQPLFSANLDDPIAAAALVLLAIGRKSPKRTLREHPPALRNPDAIPRYRPKKSPRR
jgi:hypothetical protein